ncbi:MAG: L-seryl-tRNA(Sec) selenium transferase [Planctomycetes bacterium]|nr:L-seryl-tRNA(Sec) selenium transferase [Planctomycetota bacterium]
MAAASLPRIAPMTDLLQTGTERGLAGWGREALRCALRDALDGLRADCQAGRPRQLDEGFWAEVGDRLAVVPALRLKGAINATGVVLHTNLGRAPWSDEAIAAAAAAAGYGTVEFDLETGGRGGRAPEVAAHLVRLTGAGDGLAVNNNAAAVLLALSVLAQGRKVIVARNELVEIGGSYRMPEVVAAAGAEMIEVGTTNRVHLRDFAAALADPEVGCVFKAHPSNYRIDGFTREPAVAELAAACREHGVPLVYDLGSGVLVGADLAGARDEPTVKDALAAGCDLVTFSGDKLLGGPQAGLIVGAAALVRRLRSNMLTRCLRLDKTILAALEATLAIHALGEQAARQRIPGLRMLSLDQAALRARAHALAARLSGFDVLVVDCEGRVGSGAAPVAPVASAGLSLALVGTGAAELARRLRFQPTPVVGRIQDERLLLDLRTVAEDQEDRLLEALAAVRS